MENITCPVFGFEGEPQAKKFTKKDILIIEDKLFCLKQQKDEAVKRKLNLESSLSHHQNIYKNITHKGQEFNNNKQRRQIIKNELREIELVLSKIKVESKRLNLDKAAIDVYIRENGDILNVSKDLDKLNIKIKNLISKYKKFAKDRTRISSLRVMASELVDELEELI